MSNDNHDELGRFTTAQGSLASLKMKPGDRVKESDFKKAHGEGHMEAIKSLESKMLLTEVRSQSGEREWMRSRIPMAGEKGNGFDSNRSVRAFAKKLSGTQFDGASKMLSNTADTNEAHAKAAAIIKDQGHAGQAAPVKGKEPKWITDTRAKTQANLAKGAKQAAKDKKFWDKYTGADKIAKEKGHGPAIKRALAAAKIRAKQFKDNK